MYRRDSHLTRRVKVDNNFGHIASKAGACCVSQILSGRPTLRSDRIFCELAEVVFFTTRMVVNIPSLYLNTVQFSTGELWLGRRAISGARWK